MMLDSCIVGSIVSLPIRGSPGYRTHAPGIAPTSPAHSSRLLIHAGRNPPATPAATPPQARTHRPHPPGHGDSSASNAAQADRSRHPCPPELPDATRGELNAGHGGDGP